MRTGNSAFPKLATGVFGIWLIMYSYNALTSGVAEKVTAEEITGVVVEKDTGKPVPNAVVMIRFERGNTGHGSPDCFRSMATEADGNGRFRFEPWTQEGTRADSFYGEISAYKKGYAIPRPRHEGDYIQHSRRTFLGISFSKNLHIPKTERTVELEDRMAVDAERVEVEKREAERPPRTGFPPRDKKKIDPEEWRMEELGRAASRFVCRVINPSEALLLISRIRDEVVASPLADKHVSEFTTNRSSIESQLKEIQK